MKSIYVIFAALTATALTATTLTQGFTCSFSEATGAQQCHGAVGQLLLFQLPDIADSQLRLKKDKKYKIFKLHKDKMETSKEYTNNPELFPNGSLKLGEATKKHSGDYTLEEYRLDGVLKRTLHVHLEIQAPVLKPAVSQTCLSPEKMMVSCSSEGDGVEFVLTLDDNVLIQSTDNTNFTNSRTVNTKSLVGTIEQDKPRVSSVSITLPNQVLGKFMCNVRNKVSREETVVFLESCEVSAPLAVVVVTVMAVFLAVLLLVALRRGLVFRRKNTTSTAVHEDVIGNSEDEVVYAGVRIIQRTTEPTSNQISTESSVN